MANLTDMATELVSLRQQRSSLEDTVKELKEKEDDLKKSILLEMSSLGMKSCNLEGVAKLVTRKSVRYDISNIEELAKQMMVGLIKAYKAGTPLSEAILLQLRPSRSNIEEILPEGTDEATLAAFGLKKNELTELSVSKPSTK